VFSLSRFYRTRQFRLISMANCDLRRKSRRVHKKCNGMINELLNSRERRSHCQNNFGNAVPRRSRWKRSLARFDVFFCGSSREISTSVVSEVISTATGSIKRNKTAYTLHIDQHSRQHRAVSLQEHGFLVYFAVHEILF